MKNLFEKMNSPMGFHLMISIIGLLAYTIISGNMSGFGIIDGQLLGPDSYARGDRVLEFLSTGVWFDNTLYRVNPPLGHSTHWTRAFDLLVLIFGYPLHFFIDNQSAVLISATIVPPLLMLVMFAVVFTTARIIIPDHRIAIPVALLLIFQPLMSGQFISGRIDHHSTAFIGLAFIMALVVRVFYRQMKAKEIFILSGGLAFCLWSNGELMVFIGGFIATVGLAWFFTGKRYIAENIAKISCDLCFFLFIFLFIERGFTGAFQYPNEIDRISFFYVILFGASSAFWFVCSYLKKAEESIITRILLVVVGFSICASIVYMMQPQLLHGRTNKVDPLYAKTRLVFIKESGWMFDFDLYKTSGMIAFIQDSLARYPFMIIGFLSTVFLILKRDKYFWVWLCSLVMFLVLFKLGYYKITFRFGGYLSILFMLPCLILIWYLSAKIAGMFKSDVSKRVELFSILIVFSLFSLPLPDVENNISNKENNVVSNNMNTSNVVFVGSIGKIINLAVKEKESQNILAFADFNPEIMFTTNHNVFSIPNHRTQPGYKMSYDVFNAKSDQEALALLKEYSIDYIVMSLSEQLEPFHGLSGEENTFGKELNNGEFPSWVEDISKPEYGNKVKIFKLDYKESKVKN